MTDILLVCVGLITVIGVLAFYFHGRLAYTDKKIGLLENLMMDIKMTLDVEAPGSHDHYIGSSPSSATPSDAGAPKFVPLSEEVEPEENAAAAAAPTKDESEYYAAVLQEAATDAIPTESEAAAPSVNYEAQTREELAAAAEKRGLRVTKRTSKPQIIALLKEADRRHGSSSDANNNVEATAATLGGVDASDGGAPLDAGAPQEVSLDD